tara:strand:- start:2268 stop:2843 length:576 start_codon:yes stop_codon:yes gene_type:complete
MSSRTKRKTTKKRGTRKTTKTRGTRKRSAPKMDMSCMLPLILCCGKGEKSKKLLPLILGCCGQGGKGQMGDMSCILPLLLCGSDDGLGFCEDDDDLTCLLPFLLGCFQKGSSQGKQGDELTQFMISNLIACKDGENTLTGGASKDKILKLLVLMQCCNGGSKGQSGLFGSPASMAGLFGGCGLWGGKSGSE